jgi:hypothetical protein
MRRLFPALCIIIFITACSGNKLPADVLPREKMQVVLWDLLRSTEYVNAFILNKDSTLDRGSVGAQIYDEVFRMHKVSKSTFDKSLVYYKEHPDLFKQIMDTLEKRQYVVPEVKPGNSVAVKDTQSKVSFPSPDIILDSLKKGKRPFLQR